MIASAQELLDVIAPGAVTVIVRQRYPLRRAANARRDIEERRTIGSAVRLPFA